MVRPLDRKLLRDLRRLAPQLGAIALVAAIGVGVAVMAQAALKAVGLAQQRYYAQTRFADLFAGAERAPRSLIHRLRQIDGVLAVDARASGVGLMGVPGLDRPATVRLIALPDDPVAGLNALVLRQGRLPSADRKDEAVFLANFTEAAHVRLGDRLGATIGGRRSVFTVVGTAVSPEYIYSPAAGSALPDDAHQAVLWAPRAAVEEAAGQVGAFSQLALKLASGVNPQAVTPIVDSILAPYGGTPTLTRDDQPSHAIIREAFKRLRIMAALVPPIFLAVAAGLTHMVMARLVETEREQIGLLKAFGYSNLEAAAPYLKLAALIGVAGVVAGGALGAGLGAALTRLYASYFRFPVLTAQFNWRVFIESGAAAAFAAVAGSALAASRVVRLSPAVAMQAAPPTAYRRSLLDRLGLAKPLDQPSRMILRRIERFPGKAGLTITGLAASLALLVGTLFLYAALDQVVDQTYYRSQRWSAQLGFFHPREARSALEASRLPGVLAAEPVRTVVAWAHGPRGRKKVPILGIEPGADLTRPLDRRGRVIPFKGRGVILSEALAKRLGLEPGDLAELEVIDGRRPVVRLPVTALADDYSGLSVYVARRELNRIMGDGDLVSGAQLITSSASLTPFYRALEDRPQIIAASSRDDTVALWRKEIALSFNVTIVFYMGFAGAIAFGVAYNVGRITLAERSRDLATLQVLGFSRSECAYVLFGEIALLALAATPLGMAMGYGLAHGLAAAFARDELRFPVRIGAQSLGLSLGAYLAAVGLAALTLVRRLWRLDLVAVLKTRD